MTQLPAVRLEVADGVGTIRLDRPPVNALNGDMRARLAQVAAEAGGRADVRAVVVYGGEKSFAAGADVRELAATDLAGMVADVDELQATLGAVAGIGKPTVAALTEGAARPASFRFLAQYLKSCNYLTIRGVPGSGVGGRPGSAAPAPWPGGATTWMGTWTSD